MREERVKRQIRLPVGLDAEVAAAAEARDVSVNWVVVTALERFLRPASTAAGDEPWDWATSTSGRASPTT